ncbi:uncharacterized protein [Narcine bancroftii]|uniref:uncharacterized protein n=1 Tax=Narcine bancroftii TaxID=1343680 RepID=UPI0038310A31
MFLYPLLWIVTFLPQAASALDIEEIQIPKTRFEANKGDRLLIPCSFKTDEDVQSANLRLEWGVISEPNGYYRPIYRVMGSVLEPVSEPNSYEGRAQMFISLIPKGNCSLVLQPVLTSDSGQYELRLYSEGEVTMNGQKVVVMVSDGKDAASSWLKSTKKATTLAKERMLQEVNLESCEEFVNFDKHLMTLTKGIKSVSTNTGVSTVGLEVIAGVVTGILLVGTVVGIVLCCYFYKGLKRLKQEKPKHQKHAKRRKKYKPHVPCHQEPVIRQEKEVLKVETPDLTWSSSPVDQGPYYLASDTNSTLLGSDKANND